MIELRQRGSKQYERPLEADPHYYPGHLTRKTWRMIGQTVINEMVWNQHQQAEAVVIVNGLPAVRIEGAAFYGRLGRLAELTVKGELIRSQVI